MQQLEAKLERFIRKYYKDELLRGLLFFIAIGLAYVLLVLGIEYFFWLNTWGRGILFWSFVGIEALLLIRFIGIPILRLFKLSKGIDYSEASKLIGNHFPEVKDKLLNTLQLKATAETSDLARASVLQKSKELEPIPFSLAIDYKKNLKYLKYALIPVLIFVGISLSSGVSLFSESANRVLDYKTHYAPPAPFSFHLKNPGQKVIEGQPVDIQVKVEGDKLPEEVMIELNGVSYFMQKKGTGIFEYTVAQASQDLDFYFEGNGFSSKNYRYALVNTPTISTLSVELDFPQYLNRADELVENTGNITIPEGTQVQWILDTRNTDKVEWIADSAYVFKQNNNEFSFDSQLFRSVNYSIAASNDGLERYEQLNYQIEVIRDAYPELDLEVRKDTLGDDETYFRGNVADDYGLRDVKLVYYIENQIDNSVKVDIPVKKSTVDQFYFAFPGDLQLTRGVSYTYYFEVRDNDALHGFKSTRSETFSFQSLTKEAAVDKQLELQKTSLDGLGKSVERMQDQERDLKEIQNLQKEKENLDFNDKRKIKSFLSRQKAQEEMMQSYAEKLKKSLNALDELSESPSEKSKALKERLEKNEEQLKEQEKLVDELSKLQDLMEEDELKDKLDEMAKNSKNSSRSMKQLLELTKRFFVQTKGERIGRSLNKLGSEQEKEGSSDNPQLDKQKELSESFESLKKELADLKRENEELSKPIDIPEDQKLEEEIQEAQEKAEKNLENPEDSNSQEDAKSSQKNAGNKMQKMGQKLMQQMASGGGGDVEQLQEDVEMLRQILDNLVIFSFDQEDLKNKFSNIDNGNPSFSKYLVKQNQLRDNFEHIDDSLFVLSLRNPSIQEDINEQLTEITYNLDQSLERLADNDIVKGVASEQYVFAGANTLADMLSDILDNMQAELSFAMGSGSSGAPMPFPSGGKGSGKQLSDIIMSQKQLQEKLGQAEKEGQTGDSGNQGEDGKDGKDGKEGKGAGGESGDGNQGQGQNESGSSESELARQYEIYKEQEAIRNELEDMLQQSGMDEETQRVLQYLESIEDDLLSGDSDVARRKMNEVIQQFLKMEEAEQEKDQNNQRESESTSKVYNNTTSNAIPEAKRYFNSKEILNRDKLPLQDNYKLKVKRYFKKEND